METETQTVESPQSQARPEPTPETEQRFKCFTCHHFFYERDIIITDDKAKHCPACGETQLRKMCRLDNNGCTHDVTPGIKYCPECGDPVCPACGANHDVIALSRVTGYYAEVSGWNKAKQQELKDRVRYNLLPITQNI